MFTKSAEFYDLLYGFKDYGAEVQKIHQIIQQHILSSGKTLLDIACGTGHHIQYLKRLYDVEGLDLDQNLLAFAKSKNADVPFHHGDMIDFKLDKQFDAVLCLFSSIGYVKTKDNLRAALLNMAAHVAPGGVLLVEPWLTPENYHGGRPHALYIDEPAVKIARMNVSRKEGNMSILDFHYLVATEAGIEQFNEIHELGLFSMDDHLDALKDSGLKTSYDHAGLMDRGLYIGVKPIA